MDTTEKINLGGFPPIFYISKENKKKREFEQKITENLDTSSYKKLNILNIKNILKETKKNDESN
jgi:hypothetical protein